MLTGINEDRLLAMTVEEKRLLDNIKKALYQSDTAMQSGSPEDAALPELFKAIDTAKTLRGMLRGERVSHANNKRQFIDFLSLEIPLAASGSDTWELKLEDGSVRSYGFGDIVYSIRCMIHQNENLNAAEDVDYHVLVNWEEGHPHCIAEQIGGRLVVYGTVLWRRLREVIAKFITGIEGLISFLTEGTFDITCRPSAGSILPSRNPRTRPIG